MRYATIAHVALTADSAIDVGDVTAFGITEIQGGYTLAKSGGGVLRVDAPNPAFTGSIVMDAGELWLRDYFGYHGSLENADVIAPGGNVSGCGRAGAVSVSNGWLWPCWARPLETADLSLGSGAMLFVDMFPELGAQFYGRVRVTGTVTLANPKLQPSASDPLGTALVMGTIFTIIDNDGTDPVVGTFAGSARRRDRDGTGGAESFVISYVGGDGNDVVLDGLQPARHLLPLGRRDRRLLRRRHPDREPERRSARRSR